MKNQLKWVKNQLMENGEVSRNYAISNYITRLGAIIHKLNKNGWVIRGHFEKTENGRDYIYNLIDAPKRKVVEFKNGKPYLIYV